MTLREIIKELENLSDDLVIFAVHEDTWMVDYEAALIIAGDVALDGNNLDSLKYFLEVELAKDVLKVWREWRNGREPNEAERIEAICYFASNDSYLDQL